MKDLLKNIFKKCIIKERGNHTVRMFLWKKRENVILYGCFYDNKKRGKG